VVREHGAGNVFGRARRSEVVCGGEDRVRRVPTIGAAVAVAIDAVASPGASEKLHRPARACVVNGAFLPAGRVGRATVVTLDLADTGHHLPGHAVRKAGLLVEQQVVGGNVGQGRRRRLGEADTAGGG